MEDKLRSYVEELFQAAPPTRKAVELREEMLQNLTEKYRDLIAEGKTPEAAYNIAVAGLGDVDSLIADLNRGGQNSGFEEQRKKSAVLTAMAIMLYILSPLPLIILGILASGGVAVPIGLICLFALIAAATGLIIFAGMTKPKYTKSGDGVVEDFKEWRNANQDRRALRRAISSALWCVIVVLFFVISFTTHAWYITWLIFIIGAGIESLITILFTYKSVK